MDITKLMIGDWLRIKSTGVIGQVTKLCTYKGIDHNILRINSVICDINGVEPIKLSTDILKTLKCKNNLNNEYVFSNTSFTIILHCVEQIYTSNIYKVTIKENYDKPCTECCEIVFGLIKYVHELQHLLDIFDVTCKINID